MFLGHPLQMPPCVDRDAESGLICALGVAPAQASGHEQDCTRLGHWKAETPRNRALGPHRDAAHGDIEPLVGQVREQLRPTETHEFGRPSHTFCPRACERHVEAVEPATFVTEGRVVAAGAHEQIRGPGPLRTRDAGGGCAGECQDHQTHPQSPGSAERMEVEVGRAARSGAACRVPEAWESEGRRVHGSEPSRGPVHRSFDPVPLFA